MGEDVAGCAAGSVVVVGEGTAGRAKALGALSSCDLAVTSAPQAMPPQHLWDPKQRVHISGGHYMECEPLGQFSNQFFSNLLKYFDGSCIDCLLL